MIVVVCLAWCGCVPYYWTNARRPPGAYQQDRAYCKQAAVSAHPTTKNGKSFVVSPAQPEVTNCDTTMDTSSRTWTGSTTCTTTPAKPPVVVTWDDDHGWERLAVERDCMAWFGWTSQQLEGEQPWPRHLAGE
jgi:hypothetical protein